MRKLVLRFFVNILLSATCFIFVLFILEMIRKYVLWGSYTWVGAFIVSLNLPYWLMVIVGILATILIPTTIIVLCLLLGKKLNVFGNHWLNFASTCGSFVATFGILIWVHLQNASVGFWGLLLSTIALFTSIIIWVGVDSKSPKKKEVPSATQQ